MRLRDGMRSGGNDRLRDRRKGIVSIALVVLSIALFAGCASAPPAAVRPGPFEPLEKGVGFLVIQIDAEVGIARLDLDGWAVVRDLQAGQHLWLVRMKAGNYRWTAARLAPQNVASGMIETKQIDVLDQEEFEFEVEAGQVNYPGEIVVWLADQEDGIWGGVSFRNRNHSAMAIRKLSKSHPELIAAHPLRYAGSRRDEFLQFYTQSRKSHAGAEAPVPGEK